MAFITAETRSSIVELAMGMLNQAPSSELLTTLIGKSTEGASLQDLADYIATTDAFTAEYPATQTAREFATEMFGKLITGGTLDADINTAVIDLLEGLLIAGTTKAEGFVAVINFLADSANADHPDLGDIAQAFQNRADAAEYFSVTKELGDSSDAELAAAIALVTSDAATLTAANAAADSTASAAAPVASQTLTLTTGVETISGTIADETINAPAASATTGAAATTLDSGDVIDGGAGTDTLNITMTATNNNSLAGVTVKNVEKVYVTGANFQTSGETGAALTAATAAKAATAASLTAAQAAVVTAQSQDNAADAVAAMGVDEGVVVQLATATVASAASQTAAATVVSTVADATILTQVATAATIKTAYTALSTAQKAAFTEAEYGAALKAASTSAAGVTLAAGAALTARKAAVLADRVEAEEAVKASQQDLATAIEQQSAAIAVNGTADATIVANALLTGTALTTAYNLLTADQRASFSEAQWKAATVAAATGEDGTTLLAAAVGAEKLAEKNAADSLVTFETTNGDYTLAELNAAATAALKSSVGTTLITNGDDGATINTRAGALATASAAVVTAAGTEAAKAVVADNTAASALAVATAAAAAVADASLSGASFAGSTEVWLKGADSNKTDLTVTTQAAGLSGVTGLDNKITFGATGTLAVAGSTGKVDIGGAAGGLTIGGSGGTLTLTNTGGTTEAKAVKALTISTSGAMAADVAGLAQLTTVTSNGAGGATIGNSGAKVATIVTGDGADGALIATATAKDDTTTAADETVSANVSTGAGNDTVNVKTTLAGTTTVDTGAGNDTLYVTSISSGAGTITAGDGNDTVYLTATLGANPNMTIAAGDGVDTLVMAGATFSAVDFLRMNSALSGFEAIAFNTAVGGLDVDELGIGSVGALTFQTGATVVTGVGSQALVLSGDAGVAKASTNGITPARGATYGGTDLTATAEGYVTGADGVSAPVYAGALSITSAGYSLAAAGADSQVEVNAASATITVASIGLKDALTSNAEVVDLVTSDVQSLVVNLASARGTSTNAGTEYVAAFNAGQIVKANAADQDGHLLNLSSLKVNGTGIFTIDTSGVAAKALAKLTTIDVSGMVAMADLLATGLVESTTNKSTTTLTLNTLVPETVILGGARDTVVTGSTVKATDTVTGFQLTGTVASALVADTARSDVLNLGGLGAFAKFTSTTATTFAGMLTEAGAAAGANLVFHFGGDTYVYSDKLVGGLGGLDDTDILVKLTGTLDLDQMITAGVIV
jgi:S-layer protein